MSWLEFRVRADEAAEVTRLLGRTLAYRKVEGERWSAVWDLAAHWRAHDLGLEREALVDALKQAMELLPVRDQEAVKAVYRSRLECP